MLADSIQVVGDFNDWNRRSHPLTCEHENGAWQPNIEHEKVQEYHFRYLIDGKNWQNEWHADRSIPNPFGGENSIQEI
ncbi:MAG: isoamylase early set domain-containing protein [Anaerolineae bacterium]